MTDSTSLSALQLAEADATRALLDVLDVPEPQFRSVHEDIRALMVDALVSAVEARVSEPFLKLLREIEWQGGDATTEAHRPSCEAFWPGAPEQHGYYEKRYGRGHRDFCDLAAALNRPTDVHLGGQA